MFIIKVTNYTLAPTWTPLRQLHFLNNLTIQILGSLLKYVQTYAMGIFIPELCTQFMIEQLQSTQNLID